MAPTFSPSFIALCKAIDAAKAAQDNYKAALDAAHAARLASQDADRTLRAAQMASAYEVIIDVAVSE